MAPSSSRALGLFTPSRESISNPTRFSPVHPCVMHSSPTQICKEPICAARTYEMPGYLMRTSKMPTSIRPSFAEPTSAVPASVARTSRSRISTRSTSTSPTCEVLTFRTRSPSARSSALLITMPRPTSPTRCTKTCIFSWTRSLRDASWSCPNPEPPSSSDSAWSSSAGD